MWSLEPTDLFGRRLKRYAKRHAREVTGCLANLQTYYGALQEGTHPLQIAFGFVHDERKGVYAVDQGPGKNLVETRLYFYPDTIHEVLYELTIGDKSTQPRDVQDCYEMVSDIPTSKEPPDHGSERKSGKDQTG